MTTDKDELRGVTPTITLAKLYERQGLLDEAAAVYRDLRASTLDETEGREPLEAVERSPREADRELSVRTPDAVLSQLKKWRQAVDKRKTALGRQEKAEKRLLVIHGPDLDMLDSPGTVMPQEMILGQINSDIRRAAQEGGMRTQVLRVGHKGGLARTLRDGSDGFDILIVSPEQFPPDSDIRDTLASLDVPIIEVYLSLKHCRGLCRRPLTSDVATAHLAGFGREGYVMAVKAAKRLLEA